MKFQSPRPFGRGKNFAPGQTKRKHSKFQSPRPFGRGKNAIYDKIAKIQRAGFNPRGLSAGVRTWKNVTSEIAIFLSFNPRGLSAGVRTCQRGENYGK